MEPDIIKLYYTNDNRLIRIEESSEIYRDDTGLYNLNRINPENVNLGEVQDINSRISLTITTNNVYKIEGIINKYKDRIVELIIEASEEEDDDDIIDDVINKLKSLHTLKLYCKNVIYINIKRIDNPSIQVMHLYKLGNTIININDNILLRELLILNCDSDIKHSSIKCFNTLESLVLCSIMSDTIIFHCSEYKMLSNLLLIELDFVKTISVN